MMELLGASAAAGGSAGAVAFALASWFKSRVNQRKVDVDGEGSFRHDLLERVKLVEELAAEKDRICELRISALEQARLDDRRYFDSYITLLDTHKNRLQTAFELAERASADKLVEYLKESREEVRADTVRIAAQIKDLDAHRLAMLGVAVIPPAPNPKLDELAREVERKGLGK